MPSNGEKFKIHFFQKNITSGNSLNFLSKEFGITKSASQITFLVFENFDIFEGFLH